VKIVAPLPGERAKAVVEKAERYLSHSFSRFYPLVVDSAHGSVVTDVDGNRFLDFSSGIAVLSTGSTHPRVVAAAKRQIEKFMHYSYTDFYYENFVELSDEIVKLAPGDFEKLVFWGNSGTEANEAAMKLARNYTRRPLFLAHSGSFHGRTFGALSLTASKPIQVEDAFPLLPGVVHFPFPYCYRCPWKQTFPECDYYCIDYFKEEYLEKFVPVSNVSAYVFEPIQGEGGYITPPPEYFKKMEFLRKEGILFIADEVQTGIGRTGKFFAVEHYGVVPDIISLAKGIASGLPLGGIIARADVMKSWRPGQHASTFGANPVAVEAAIATLRVISEEELLSNARRMGGTAMKRLLIMKEKYEIIGDVRGLGLFIGVELVRSRKTKERAEKETKMVIERCFKKGLIVISAGRNTVRIIPPLNITRDELEEGLDLFETVVASVDKELREGRVNV
jgi:4-aminobutyrate aminotransferase